MAWFCRDDVLWVVWTSHRSVSLCSLPTVQVSLASPQPYSIAWMKSARDRCQCQRQVPGIVTWFCSVISSVFDVWARQLVETLTSYGIENFHVESRALWWTDALFEKFKCCKYQWNLMSSTSTTLLSSVICCFQCRVYVYCFLLFIIDLVVVDCMHHADIDAQLPI